MVATSVSIGINSATFRHMNSGIGSYVKARRTDLGLTQEELSTRSGVGRAQIAQIEGGRVALPGADPRRRLAKALGVSHLDMLIAAGEITEDEIQPLGVQGVAHPDPELAAVVAAIQRIRPTPMRLRSLWSIVELAAESDNRAAPNASEGDPAHRLHKPVGSLH